MIGDARHPQVVCESSNSKSAEFRVRKCWIRERSASVNNSRWGVGLFQLSSADSIYDLTLQTTDDFLTPTALMTCTRTCPHATRACSCMVCFLVGYIVPELRKFIMC